MRIGTCLAFTAVLLIITTAAVNIAETEDIGEIRDVRVVNFPETQNVTGKVEIESPLDHSRFYRIEGAVVSPSSRTDTSDMIKKGYLDTSGFTSLSLNMQGEVKGTVRQSGKVGVILVPDEEPVMRMFEDRNIIQFPLEKSVDVLKGGSAYFSIDRGELFPAFPRYAVYLYNSTDKSVEVNIYAYLKN